MCDDSWCVKVIKSRPRHSSHLFLVSTSIESLHVHTYTKQYVSTVPTRYTQYMYIQYIYIQICTHCVYTYICMYMYIYIHIYMYMSHILYIYTCVYIYIHIMIYIYIHTYIWIYMYTFYIQMHGRYGTTSPGGFHLGVLLRSSGGGRARSSWS